MVSSDKGDLLPGTLEMLDSGDATREPLHGYAIAQRIQQNSTISSAWKKVLSTRPAAAAHRGLGFGRMGDIGAETRIRIYTLTASGRKQLGRGNEASGPRNRRDRPCDEAIPA